MGWTFTHREKGEATNAEWFTRELCGPTLKILEHATVGGTFYAAVEVLEGNDKGTVFGLVVLTRWVRGDYHNYGWKEMEDSMGPGESEAPAKVLDLLTPTTSAWANEWRARCRATIERKARARAVKPGTAVVFNEPLQFGNGFSEQTFTFEKGSTFRAGFGRCRIPSWRNRADWVAAA